MFDAPRGPLASHVTLYQPDATVLLLAPSQNRSRETYKKAMAFLNAADAEPDAESAMRIALPNGSRGVSPFGNPKTVRGFGAPRLIVVDEAAFVQNEAICRAITPDTLRRRPAHLHRSPNGRRGFFYHAWQHPHPWPAWPL